MRTGVGKWIKDNVLEIILGIMLTAFFINYQADRADTKEFREEMRNSFQEQERKNFVLYLTIIADPSLTETQKEILREYAPTRSGNTNTK